MSFIIVYITNADATAAQKLVAHLLEKKLIACANIFPIESAYWWAGAIAQEGEVVALVKTSSKNWAILQQEVEVIHPYEVPCILKIEASANAAYERWIEESCV